MQITMPEVLIRGARTGRRKRQRTKHAASRPCYRFRFDDQWKFARQTEPPITGINDFSGVPFDAEFDEFAKQARRPLDGLEVDFLWVALAVYLADRFAPRHPFGVNGPAFWRRDIRVAVPVSQPAKWLEAEGSLARALAFLTEDDWSFEFIPSRSPFSAESQEHFRKMRGPQVEWVSLFSGGLDSLAGALRRLQGTRGCGLLVSGQTSSRMKTGQELLVHDVLQHFSQRVEHVGVGYGLPDKSGLSGFESSQRTRAFVHVTFGSAAALLAECRQLFLFENGFGALNLPCDSAQFASQNSRGAHPVFLQRMAAFVAALFGEPFVVANPFAFHTKAQMLSGPMLRRFSSLFQQSFSCDRFPNYPRRASQCGHCASCLIRRLAFHGAQLLDDGAGYSIDLFHPRRSAKGSELVALTKLCIQAETLVVKLRCPKPWAALCATWPDLLRTELELGMPTFSDSIIPLLRRHVNEWRSFSSALSRPAFALAA